VAILEILADNTTQVFLSEKDQSINNVTLQRTMVSLQEGVAVGRLCREPDRLDSSAFEESAKCGAERTSPIHQQVSLPARKPADHIGQVARDF